MERFANGEVIGADASQLVKYQSNASADSGQLLVKLGFNPGLYPTSQPASRWPLLNGSTK